MTATTVATAPTAPTAPTQRPTFDMLPVQANRPRISQFFGHTLWAASGGRDYYRACQGRHPGLDFAVPVGTPLLALADGVVMCAGVANRDCPFGGGAPNVIIIRYGTVYAIYGHASSVAVAKGQRVAAGDVVGASGDSNGAHLHFEIRPVPDQVRADIDMEREPLNAGIAHNPIDYFSAALNRWFDECYARLGGARHFCSGTLRDQPLVVFGAALDTRPCTHHSTARRMLETPRAFLRTVAKMARLRRGN